MAKKFEYTTRAYRYTARFPVLTYVGTEANFWIIANLLLVSITTLQSQIISQAYQLPVAGRFGPMAVLAVLLGVLYGVILGLTGYYLDKKLFRKSTAWKSNRIQDLHITGCAHPHHGPSRYVFFDPFISPSLSTFRPPP